MTERDISGLMSLFKEAARHLWRVSFRPLTEDRSFAHLDMRYDEVVSMLFSVMVLEGCRAEFTYAERMQDIRHQVRIKLNADVQYPIMISRNRGIDGYWDHPVTSLPGGSVVLRFVGFFDWDRVDHCDYRYWIVEILEHHDLPEVVGHCALLESSYGVPVIDER